MFKRIAATIVMIVSLFSVTPAMAGGCEIAPSKQEVVFSTDLTVDAILSRLNLPEGCAPKDLVSAFRHFNQKVTGDIVPAGTSVNLPMKPPAQTFESTPVVQPTQSAVSAPTPAPAPVPTVVEGKDYGPELARLQLERVNVQKQLTNLENAVNQRPASVVLGSETKLREELEAKDTALGLRIDGIMAILKSHQDAIRSNTTAIRSLTTRTGALEIRMNGKADIEAVKTAQETADEAKQLAQSAGGWTLRDWGVAILALLALALAVWSFFTKASKKRVTALASDVVEGRKKRLGVAIEQNMEAVLQSLVVNEAREVHVEFDGTAGLLRFVKVAGNKVTTTQIQSQTQAMKIETLRSTLLRHIGAGRVTLMPYDPPRSAVNA